MSTVSESIQTDIPSAFIFTDNAADALACYPAP
jgi:hypothetical protein